MSFDPQGFQLQDAISTNQDIYEVPFLSWGVRTVAASANAVNPDFQFPPPGQPGMPASVAGIAIGPRSTVDRAWVSWNRQKPSQQGAPVIGPFDSGIPTSRVRPLSVHSPIMFQQAAGAGAVPTAQAFTGIYNPNNSPTFAMQNGLLYVWPKEPTPFPGSTMGADTVCTTAQSTTILPATFEDQVGGAWNFNGTNTFAKFYPPFLELYLYLKPPLFAPPTRRFPLFVSDSITLTSGSGGYVLVEMIPIFGRASVTIACRASTNAATFRAGLVNCVRENAGVSSAPPFEGPGGTTGSLATALDSGIIQITNPCSDYLMIYANVGSNPTTVDIQVSAYD